MKQAKLKTSSELKDLILSVYDLLDNTSNKKYYKLIEEKLNTLIKENKLVNELLTENLKFILMCEPFHNNISLKNMHKAANILNIPLDEYVYIPKYKTYTKNKVPVGINK